MLLNSFLRVFRSILLELIDDNVVIGGINALALHGIIVGREANDLDIIIYNPTPRQTALLSALNHFNMIKDKNTENGYDGTNVAFIKLKKDNCKMDILIERDREVPGFLLRYPFEGYNLKIQSVENVIHAKASYYFKSKKDGLTFYSRIKDAIDFQNLKNLNFNLSSPKEEQ